MRACFDGGEGGQPDDLRAKAADAVRAAFSRQPGETSMLIDGAAWIATARNPAT